MIVCAASNNAGKLKELRRILERMGHESKACGNWASRSTPRRPARPLPKMHASSRGVLQGERPAHRGGRFGPLHRRIERCARRLQRPLCRAPRDDDANNEKLTARDGRCAGRAARRKVCVRRLLYAAGRPCARGRGECPGRIAFSLQNGDYGFGYDPLFIPDAYGTPDGCRPNTEGRSYAS